LIPLRSLSKILFFLLQGAKGRPSQPRRPPPQKRVASWGVWVVERKNELAHVKII
jgi:hypothetical protein